MPEAQTQFSNEFEARAFKRRADTSAVQMNVQSVAEALKNDGEFFINFFHGDELDFPVPKFHLDTWDLFIAQDILQVAIALPRGHAKTTLAKLATVHYILFSEFSFLIYLGNTHTAAVEACQDIINFLLTPNAIAVFGPPKFKVEQEQRGLYKFEINLPLSLDENGVPMTKFIILKAHGAGQAVRGMNIDNKRPELAILDDIEDDKNTSTELSSRKLKQWFYGPFIKAMSRKLKKLIFLGNLISDTGLLNQLLSSQMWYSMRIGCLKADGEPLWPELWPVEALTQDFIEYQRVGMSGRWFAEMMNIPMNDSSPLLAEEDIFYQPMRIPGQQKYAFITIDPAISKKTWADDTAIVVHAYVEGVWQVVDYIAGKFNPDETFGLIKELCIKWECRTVGIEMAAFQKALKFLFELMMEINMFQFTVIELSHGNQRKTDRLAMFVSAMRQKIYALTMGDFAITEQLLKYDPTKDENNDDIIDACASGPVMIENYMNYIIDDYAPQELPMGVISDYIQQRI